MTGGSFFKHSHEAMLHVSEQNQALSASHAPGDRAIERNSKAKWQTMSDSLKIIASAYKTESIVRLNYPAGRSDQRDDRQELNSFSNMTNGSSFSWHKQLHKSMLVIYSVLQLFIFLYVFTVLSLQQICASAVLTSKLSAHSEDGRHFLFNLFS